MDICPHFPCFNGNVDFEDGIDITVLPSGQDIPYIKVAMALPRTKKALEQKSIESPHLSYHPSLYHLNTATA